MPTASTERGGELRLTTATGAVAAIGGTMMRVARMIEA